MPPKKKSKRPIVRLARAYQVDSYSGNRAAEIRFREIAEAYAVLSDKDKRARYDQAGLNFFATEADGELDWEEEEICNFEGFEEFFEESFGKRSPFSIPSPKRARKFTIACESVSTSRSGGRRLEFRSRKRFPARNASDRGMIRRVPWKPAGNAAGPATFRSGFIPRRSRSRCRRCQGWGRIRRQPCSACEGTKRRAPEKNALSLRSARRERWLPDLPERSGGKGAQRRGERRSRRHPGDSKAPLLSKKGRGSLCGGSFDGLGSGPGNPNESSHPEGKRLDNGSSRSPKRPENAAGWARRGPLFTGRPKGSQMLTFKIVVPRDLDPRSLDLLRELQERSRL